MLLLVAGAWQVVGRPIAAAVNSSPAPAATTTVSDDQARTTAVVAVTDWLTYNPQTLSAYRNIAGARFGNGAAASAWSGSAWMAPDAVTAGTVVTQPDGDLVTQVTARVRIATPAQPTKTPTPPQSTSGDPGNDPTVPAGWTVVSTQWLHLLVPITAAGRPDPAGPVLATANQPRTTTATRHRINRLHCDDQQPTVGGQPVHRIGRDRRDRTRLPHHEPTDHQRSGDSSLSSSNRHESHPSLPYLLTSRQRLGRGAVPVGGAPGERAAFRELPHDREALVRNERGHRRPGVEVRDLPRPPQRVDRRGGQRVLRPSRAPRILRVWVLREPLRQDLLVPLLPVREDGRDGVAVVVLAGYRRHQDHWRGHVCRLVIHAMTDACGIFQTAFGPVPMR